MTSSSTAAPVDARPWLPADVRPSALVQARLATLVADWSATWFAAGDGGSTEMTPTPLARDERGDLHWRSLDGGPAIGLSADAALTVGAQMLDVLAVDRAPRDRVLLEELAEPCLADLRDRLAAMAGTARGAEWRPSTQGSGWLASIGGVHGPIAILVPDAFFATLVRRSLPDAESPPLGSGVVALAGIDVAVSAAVGRAALSVADLRALEIGDVVVLDRALADPVPIAADARALPRGTVRIVPADPRPFLEIVDAAA